MTATTTPTTPTTWLSCMDHPRNYAIWKADEHHALPYIVSCKCGRWSMVTLETALKMSALGAAVMEKKK